MRKTEYVCDRCKETIKGTVYKIAGFNINPENGEGPERGFIEVKKVGDLDLCEKCAEVVDLELKEKFEKQEPEIKKSPKKAKEGKNTLDDGKIVALRKAGWSLKAIADEMGVASIQTIANHLAAAGYEEKKK